MKKIDYFVEDDDRSYRLYLNPIRIAFAFLTILLIILCILTGLLYGLDLISQSSCRLIHQDYSFIVSLITGDTLHEKTSDENIFINR